MATVTGIQVLGNSLLATYSDKSTQLFYPANGLFIPNSRTASVPQGSGGESTGSGTAHAVPGSVAAPVDDYPWPDAPQDDMSPLRYSYRDCTDFVAWRCNRDNNCVASPWKWTWANLRYQNGDAIGWHDDWQHYGRGVDLPASAGTIAWYGSKVGAYGHVAYVQAVAADGTLHLEEYNWGDTQAYNQRDAAPGSTYYPDSFLAIPT